IGQLIRDRSLVLESGGRIARGGRGSDGRTTAHTGHGWPTIPGCRTGGDTLAYVIGGGGIFVCRERYLAAGTCFLEEQNWHHHHAELRATKCGRTIGRRCTLSNRSERDYSVRRLRRSCTQEVDSSRRDIHITNRLSVSENVESLSGQQRDETDDTSSFWTVAGELATDEQNITPTPQDFDCTYFERQPNTPAQISISSRETYTKRRSICPSTHSAAPPSMFLNRARVKTIQWRTGNLILEATPLPQKTSLLRATLDNCSEEEKNCECLTDSFRKIFIKSCNRLILIIGQTRRRVISRATNEYIADNEDRSGPLLIKQPRTHPLSDSPLYPICRNEKGGCATILFTRDEMMNGLRSASRLAGCHR
ncbi:unnamed protein product, partial [Trichogramma brassicae]